MKKSPLLKILETSKTSRNLGQRIQPIASELVIIELAFLSKTETKLSLQEYCTAENSIEIFPDKWGLMAVDYHLSINGDQGIDSDRV